MKSLLQLLSFLLLAISQFAFGASELQFPLKSPDFTYKIQTYPHIESDINSLLTSFDQFFVERELNPVILPDGFNETKTSLSSINRIYSGDLGRTVVFIKAGVIPNLIPVMDKSVQIGNGFLHHFKQSNGLVVAVFVQTENWENASEIFSNLQPRFVTAIETKKQNFVTRAVLSFLPMSSAYAQDTNCDPKIIKTQQSLENLVTTGEALSDRASLIQHVSGCTLSAIKGVWNGSGGAVIGGIKGVAEFVSSPVETGKKYWQSTTKLWDVTQHFFNDFENEARKLYPAFDSLDPLVKSKLACQVAGTIGGGVLLTYLSAGVMTSAAVANVLLRIKTAIKEAMDFVKFYKLGKALDAAAVTMEKVDTNLKSNFFTMARGSPAASVASNNQVLEGLKNLPMNANPGKRKAGLSSSEIQKLYREVENHPVAAIAKVANYDKNNIGIGYCFGRATTAHIKALLNGADKSSIRKVWALGDLKNGDTHWRYHVTTIVRDAKGDWYAIDPIMGKVLPVEKWYSEMKKYDSVGNMRIFDTDAKRFSPGSPAKYSPRELRGEQYENYFSDLMKSFQDEVKTMISTRKAN
jgi:hypothetical protein